MNKVGRELFSIQRGTDGLFIVVRPVTDKLNSLLSHWAGLSKSYSKCAVQDLVSSSYDSRFRMFIVYSNMA